MNYEQYKESWNKKTDKQLLKEYNSWEKYFDKHERAYHWHGAGMTPPNELSDGDKTSAIKEILNERGITY